MKLPLTRQKRTEENRLEEAQELLNEIEAAGSHANPRQQDSLTKELPFSFRSVN